MKKQILLFEINNNRINKELPENFVVGISAPKTLMWQGAICALYNYGSLPFLFSTLGITVVDASDIKHITKEESANKYPNGFLEIPHTSLMRVLLNTFIRMTGVEDDLILTGALPGILPDEEKTCDMDCDKCDVFHGVDNISKYIVDEDGNILICDFELSADVAPDEEKRLCLLNLLNEVVVQFADEIGEGDIKVETDGDVEFLSEKNASSEIDVSHCDGNDKLFSFGCKFDEQADVQSIHIVLVNPDYETEYQKYSDFVRNAMNVLMKDEAFRACIIPSTFMPTDCDEDDGECDDCNCCDCGYSACDEDDDFDTLYDCCATLEYAKDGNIVHFGMRLCPDLPCSDPEKSRAFINEVALYLADSFGLNNIIKDRKLYGSCDKVCYESDNIDVSIAFAENSDVISELVFVYINEKANDTDRAVCNKLVEMVLDSGLFELESGEYRLS